MGHPSTGQAVLVALLLAGSAEAQVYKCKGAGGATIYAQAPCGPDAREVELPKQASVQPGGSGQRDYRQDMLKSNDRSNAAMAERNCINAASGRVWASTNVQIAAYDRQIAQLRVQMGPANNNVAGATWISGLRTQIAGLEQSKATERSAAESRMQLENQQCAQARLRAEQAIDQRYAPPASPAPTPAG